MSNRKITQAPGLSQGLGKSRRPQQRGIWAFLLGNWTL
jgi:hypothetical protein